MKKTLVNKINKNHNGYTVEMNGLNYICDGYGFYLVADLDGADPAALRPMSTEKNSAGHILVDAARAFQYNELIPVYNLGTVTREIGRKKAVYCIIQDESKEQTAAYDEKLIGLAENSTHFEFFFFSPSGSFSPKSTFLVGVYDGIVSLVLLPVNLKDADFEALAAEATANAAAELEAKQAKKTAAKEHKKALAAAMEAAKQMQEKEPTPAEDPAPVAPVQDKPAEDQADAAADNEPETVQADQDKPAKREKKPEPREIMTKEEAAGLLTGPDWITNAAILIGFDMRNSNLIMQAALDAGLLTPQMIVEYLFYYKMPAFHTFNAWKDHGYIVKRGEKAAFQADIWKYTEKHGTMTAEEADSLNAIMTDADGGELFHAGDETTESRYLMKTAYFFTAEQVEKIQRGQVDLPDDCKMETQDGREIITGNTRPIKEQIKAAGYMWDRKASCWWRPAEDPAA